jgi:hypothetical protein
VRKLSSFSSYLPKAAAIALAGGMALLSGCGLGTIATDVTPEAVTAVRIDGTAFGGSTAISGATVTLYVSGTAGYGSTPTYSTTAHALTAATTGAFSFSPSFATSSCTTPASQIVYLTVTGGDPTGVDASGNTNNHAILLASVLGLCSNLSNAASLHVAVNEATTVAAAYALSGFSTVTSSAGGFASLSIGAPSTNTQGLLDAAANALLLVSSSSTTAGAAGLGNANASTSTVELPTAALNTVANAITGCVNASEYNVAPCSGATGLFALATPPSGTAPSNVYQATINIAKYPGQNVAAIMQLPTGSSPFQPTLPVTTVGTSTAPNDLTLGIAFLDPTAGSLSTPPTSLVIDKNDNVISLGSGTSSGTKPHYLTKLTSGSAGYTLTDTAISGLTSGTPQQATIDGNNNIYMSNSNAGCIYKIPGEDPTLPQSILLISPDGGTPSCTNSSQTADVAQNTWGIAVDSGGNVWTSAYRTTVPSPKCASTGTTANTLCLIEELPSGGTAFSYQFGSNNTAFYTNSARGFAADSNNNAAASSYKGLIWAGNYADNTVSVLNPTSGTQLQPTVGATGSNPLGIAFDHSSNAWVTTYALPGLFKVAAGGGTAGVAATAYSPSTVASSSGAPASSATTAVALGGLYHPRYLAVDGAGNVWVANAGYGTLVEYVPTYTDSGDINGPGAYLSPYYGFSPSISTTAAPSNQSVFTCTGTTTITCSVTNSQATSNYPVSIDRAGSVWTLSTNNGTLLEILGTAAPTDPVLTDGVYGVTP